MVSPEDPNWLSDYPLIDGAFSDQNLTYPWQIDLGSASVSVEVDGFLCDSDVIKESSGSRKRIKSESCSGSSSKECREKQRRDRLNEKYYFLEEKNELRDEKQKLTMDMERIEQQLNEIKTQSQSQTCFLPNPSTLSQVQAHGSKLVPFTTYPGFAMWQFMPPAAVVTSQDHVLRPPVA